MTERTYHINGPVIRNRAKDLIAALPLDGKGWDVTVKRHVDRRTDNANSVMHITWREFGQELGWDEYEVKQYFKQEYGPKVEREVGNKTILLPKSSREYSSKEARDMIDTAHRIAGEHGVMLPDHHVVPEAA